MATATANARMLTLHANRAADLMVPNPVSLRADANIREALVLFTDRGISAAPVIDDGGRPIGVLSRSDLLVHDREAGFRAFGDEGEDRPMPEGFHVENVDRTLVSDLMTPAVFTVQANDPPERVIREMVSLRVHRLFVVDEVGTLIGVVSTMDLLRRLAM
ncbi:MAG: CBS domain-containing protein [Gemmataceae bacterium]